MEVKIDSPSPATVAVRSWCAHKRDAGLLQEPKATAETLEDDVWMHTGDLALMDENRNISIKAAARTCCWVPADRTSTRRDRREAQQPSLCGRVYRGAEGGQDHRLVHPDYNEALANGSAPSASTVSWSRTARPSTICCRATVSCRHQDLRRGIRENAQTLIKRYLYHNRRQSNRVTAVSGCFFSRRFRR